MVRYCDDDELCYEMTQKGRTLVEDLRIAAEMEKKEKDMLAFDSLSADSSMGYGNRKCRRSAVI